jgi:hypothetical protein
LAGDAIFQNPTSNFFRTQHQKNMTRATAEQAPEHRVALCDEWAIWRCAGLRGAGFPATETLRLSAPEAARAADSFRQAEERAEQLGAAVLKVIDEELDALRETNEWDRKDKRGPLLDARRRLKAGKPVGSLQSQRVNEAAQAFANARAIAAEAEEEYRETYHRSLLYISETIREIAAGNRFLEAVTWQNRQAFHTAINVLLGKSSDAAKRGSKQRQHEELIASYIQRYSVKNDTIGFFGPVGWANIDSRSELVTCKTGADLLAARQVYFEEWCINQLSKTFANDEAVKPWMVPIPMPNIRLEGTTIHTTLGSRAISKEQAFVLHACDGKRCAKEIARIFHSELRGGKSAEVEAYEILNQLAKEGAVFWGFYIPLNAHPEKALRESLNRIEIDDLRKRLISELDELEHARDAVARAAGDAYKLDKALSDLGSVFERLTGKAATRAAGEMYAARTLVYEDCRRDIEITIGANLLRELAEPLGLLATSARWLTWETAKVCRKKITQLHSQLAQKTGSTTVDFLRLWTMFQPHAATPSLLQEVVREFQDRWARTLSLRADENRLQYSSRDLRQEVLSEFSAPRPGWKTARHHSPDVMISAPSVDAINRGEYELVLGEFHLGSNTLAASLFVKQHESPESLTRAVEFDMPEIRVVPLPPKGWPRVTARTSYALLSPKDFQLEFSHDAFAIDRSRALPASSLVVEETRDGLMARTRDGKHRFDLLDIIESQLSMIVINLFNILKPERHTPRVSIDRLVVSRETWRFAPDEMSFAFEKEDDRRFVAARRWAESCGIPRFVFVKTPVEVKPVYVDFNSPIYVDIFAKLVRRVAEARNETDDVSEDVITVSEMMPLFDQSWLQDDEAQRYTSEFRLVVIDLAR